MKIAHRGGHSLRCLGAIGILNEYSEMQQLFKEVDLVLRAYGHETVDCNSNADTQNGELMEGVGKANSSNADYFFAWHMNSFDSTAHGVESFVYSSSSKAYPIAQRLVNNFSKLGFTNRGVKINSNFSDLRNSDMPAIIFENCFCDNQGDVNIFKMFGYKRLAHAICNAIDPNIPLEPPIATQKPQENKPVENIQDNVFYRVVTGSYKDRSNAEEQIKKLKQAGFESFIDIYKK